MDIHPFDRAVRLNPVGPGEWSATTSDDYWNMVGPFGGYIAALLLKSALDDPRREGEPVALTVNFCAPVKKGNMRLIARPARTGRTTRHWTREMHQDGCVATATAMFGARPDTFAHRNRTAPEATPPSELERFGAFPSGWTQQYDLRFASGALDFSDAQQTPRPSRSLLWIDSIPPRPLDFVGLAALADVFFGRIIHLRGRMVPFGTVSLTTYFHATGAELAALGVGPVLGDADGRDFARGYHDQTAELWSEDGRLIATSHQLVYYRDPA